MPRVVPSDVVRIIDAMFPWASTPRASNQNHPGLGKAQLGSTAAVVDLTERVPEGLLVSSPAEYANFLSGLAALRATIQVWQSNPTYIWDGAGYEQHPLCMVRSYLAGCPDEYPAPATAALSFITPDALRESIRLDISAANQDLANGEWKGATVLAGSAVEALLLWAVQQQSAATIAAAGAGLVGPGRPLRHIPDPDPEQWQLHEYTEVAAHLGLIKSDAAAQARQARTFRNLIHPGRAARLGQKCDRGTALAALAAVEFVVRDLA